MVASKATEKVILCTATHIHSVIQSHTVKNKQWHKQEKRNRQRIWDFKQHELNNNDIHRNLTSFDIHFISFRPFCLAAAAQVWERMWSIFFCLLNVQFQWYRHSSQPALAHQITVPKKSYTAEGKYDELHAPPYITNSNRKERIESTQTILSVWEIRKRISMLIHWLPRRHCAFCSCIAHSFSRPKTRNRIKWATFCPQNNRW